MEEIVYRAKHRYADMSARKVRPFTALIRGKTVDEALQQLRFLPNRGARLVEAVVKSAMGNAEDRGAGDPEGLILVEARVDDAPMFKRIMPRARGTAYSILRRMCHIHIAIADETVEETETIGAGTPATTVPTENVPNTQPAVVA
jgi:large subunit ribosomal protein L22